MGEEDGGASIISILFAVAFTAVLLISMWKVFTKAGQPGWACIVPIYNYYVLCKIGGKPGWWLVLLLIPFVNFVVAFLVTIGIAKAFGKGVGFGIGLLLLSFIFFPILAFSDAKYTALPEA